MEQRHRDVNQLENNYNRDLAPTFAELFSSDLKDYWNAEYLWTIPSIGGALPGGTEFPGIILENKGWGKYNGWGQMKPLLRHLRRNGERW